MSLFGMMLDGLIVVLLAVTIGYCWRLTRRIRVLQDSKSELAQLLKHFDESTQRAAESIVALQTASKKIGENIQFRIDKANYLLDDLSFMIEKGNKLSNQVEASLAVSRARVKMMEEAPPMEHPLEPVEKSPTSREKTSATLEAVLERVVGRGGRQAPPMSAPPERPEPKARSRAEQELLEMIKAGIKG